MASNLSNYKLPPHIALITKKNLLNKGDYNTLRQFLYSAPKTLDRQGFVEKLSSKFGPVVAQKVWTEKDTVIVQKNAIPEKKAIPVLGMNNPKGKRPGKQQRSPAELKNFLYNIELKAIPGVSKQPKGDKLIINKHGKQYIRQMAFILCRQGDDPAPFLKRLETFFGADLSDLINDRTLKTLEKGCEMHLVAESDGIRPEDEEEGFLHRLVHNLTYRDIPQLRNVDGKHCLTNVSCEWLRDKIRRIMAKNTQLNSFLIKIGDMFGSSLKMVFSEKFRKEMSEILLPKYKCEKLDQLKYWMDEKKYKTSNESFFPANGDSQRPMDSAFEFQPAWQNANSVATTGNYGGVQNVDFTNDSFFVSSDTVVVPTYKDSVQRPKVPLIRPRFENQVPQAPRFFRPHFENPGFQAPFFRPRFEMEASQSRFMRPHFASEVFRPFVNSGPIFENRGFRPPLPTYRQPLLQPPRLFRQPNVPNFNRPLLGGFPRFRPPLMPQRNVFPGSGFF